MTNESSVMKAQAVRNRNWILLILLVFATFITVVIAWLRSLPPWEISVHNSPQGIVIEVYKTDATTPTYKTLLPGKSVGTEVTRVTRTKLPANLGRTTFFDETFKPGRWTVIIADTELDIMERALIVNGKTEIPPQ